MANSLHPDIAPPARPVSSQGGRAGELDRALRALLTQTPQLEAAAVVSYDGLPMASALPGGMDEERVAAMSAALLSLGERAAQGLGRGALTQVYVEGEAGTVFLISADDEAVLVAVAARGAKTGLVLFEARRTAAAVAQILRDSDDEDDVGASPSDDLAAGSAAEATGVPAPRPMPVREVPAPALRAVTSDVPAHGWAAWGSTQASAADAPADEAAGSPTNSPRNAEPSIVSPTTPW